MNTVRQEARLFSPDTVRDVAGLALLLLVMALIFKGLPQP